MFLIIQGSKEWQAIEDHLISALSEARAGAHVDLTGIIFEDRVVISGLAYSRVICSCSTGGCETVTEYMRRIDEAISAVASAMEEMQKVTERRASHMTPTEIRI